MSAETARAEATRAGARPRVTHVLVCGATEAAVDAALLLRRFGEAVTLLADDVHAEPRQALERSGVRVVLGPPANARALEEARAAEARAAIITAASDLACIETLLAVQTCVPSLPLVCCVSDPELAIRAERSLGVRTAICPSAIEATHLAGCSFGPDVVGAFALGDDLVLLRRSCAASSPHTLVGQLQDAGIGVLMIEERDGRRIVAPAAAFSIAPNSIVTTIERVRSVVPNARTRVIGSIELAARTIRGNTPPALAWTAWVLAFLAAASVFVFMSGMNISFSDAAYLVLNTISTVGYGDITPFGSGRAMHLVGSFVALLGPALLGTLLLIFARAVLRPQRQVPPARGHVIIAASPAVAAATASQLARVAIGSAVLSPEASVETFLRETNAAAASALIAATGDPVKNITLGLAAREINPAIHVVMRGPVGIAQGMSMTRPASATEASISFAASAALVSGLRYALAIDDRVFSFFEGVAGNDWGGQRPSDVSGSYNFVTLFRRAAGGSWRSADVDAAFQKNETILVAAWRRLEQPGRER